MTGYAPEGKKLAHRVRRAVMIESLPSSTDDASRETFAPAQGNAAPFRPNVAVLS